MGIPAAEGPQHGAEMQSSDTQLAAGCAAPAKAHLAVISPSAAQGHAEPIIAFPQRSEMKQLDKNIIKCVPEFF